MNGLDENNITFDTRTLRDSITDSAFSAIQIGQSFNGKILSLEFYYFWPIIGPGFK